MALKLGKSAIGNEPRADSDAVEEISSAPPTQRLQNALGSDSTNQQDEVMIENEFESEDIEIRKYTQYNCMNTSISQY